MQPRPLTSPSEASATERRRASPLALRRLLALVRPHRLIFFVAMCGLALGSGVNLLLPEVIRQLIDGPYAALLRENQRLVGAALIGIFALQASGFYLRSYFFGVIGQRVVAALRKQLVDSILGQEVTFFDERRTGDLISRLHADTQLIQDTVSIRLSILVRYALQVVVGIGLMVWISPQLTLAIIVLVPLLVFFSIFLGRKLRRLSRAQQSELGEATTVAEEAFTAIRVVKAFARELFEARRYERVNARVLDLGERRTAVSAFFSSFVSFLMNGCIVLVLLYGLSIVGAGELSTGDLTAFLLYGVIVAVSFAFIASTWSEMMQSAGAAERIFEILDLTPSLGVAIGAPARLTEWRGDVEFSAVSFSYPTRPTVPVLDEVAFTLAPGESTALVGPSGSGKSTIVSLLLGFYRPAKGEIRCGGHDLATLSLDELRRQIAIVPQEPQLFATTIAENLRYGKETASDTELAQACAQANILEFIESLPEGFDTPVGERGVQLSAGQKQRLVIARAMLKDPVLLILDEATSALDSENEYLVQKALASLLENRTALIIAHRLSTIKNCDRLLVIEHGRIVQSGTHESLSRGPGLYSQLVSRQELTS
ncbi:MAG: hypothetical protein RL417_2107 [Pseudomonadota bacterium]